MFFGNYDPLKKEMVRILDVDGNLNEELAPKELTLDVVKDLYEKMVFVRLADKRMRNMQRTGRMGTIASLEGQEACQIGSAFALDKKDWMTESFREHAAIWMHGVPMEKVFLTWVGNEEGGKIPEGVNVLPPAITVGNQMLHAVGIALAEKMKKSDAVAITYFGDGATSEGDFHEAMNMAGVFQSPTVFFCQNNQYAISTRREMQTKSETLAQKGIAYGIPSVLVDGNDIFAVFAVTKEAILRGREGKGPSFIEAYTYRFGDHTSSDDSRKYRDSKEVEEWRKFDPLIRVQNFLAKQGVWSEEYEKELIDKSMDEIEKITLNVENTPKQSIDDLFDYVFKDIPQDLINQKEYLKNVLNIKNN